MSAFVPPASLLRGLSVETAQKLGMPNVGAHYAGKGVRTNRLDHGAACAFCGREAANSHHEPNVGMGARNAFFELHGFELKPALIALCGSGTAGCHGDRHNGRLRIRWEWDSDECAEAWWNGDMLREFGPASPMLYGFGEWVFEKEGRVAARVRGL